MLRLSRSNRNIEPIKLSSYQCNYISYFSHVRIFHCSVLKPELSSMHTHAAEHTHARAPKLCINGNVLQTQSMYNRLFYARPRINTVKTSAKHLSICNQKWAYSQATILVVYLIQSASIKFTFLTFKNYKSLHLNCTHTQWVYLLYKYSNDEHLLKTV